MMIIGLSSEALMSLFHAPSSWALVGRSLLGSRILTAIRNNCFLSLSPFILSIFRQEMLLRLLCFRPVSC